MNTLGYIIIGAAILVTAMFLLEGICILKANRSKDDHQKKFAQRTTT